MRLLMLTAAALCLAACGNNDQKDNTQNVDDNLTAENIVSNDVTAIDAVTGDAANMAADVNYSEPANDLENAGNVEMPKAAPAPRPRTPRPETRAPVTNPTTNAPSNTAG